MKPTADAAVVPARISPLVASIAISELRRQVWLVRVAVLLFKTNYLLSSKTGWVFDAPYGLSRDIGMLQCR